jgi:holliday junction DNA helicase RuvA
MIAYLKGTIKYIFENYIILDVNNVGYKVFAGYSLLAKKLGSELEVFTYHNLREDAEDLFGFINFNELEFFEKLISVKGIGPKTAMNILSSANDVNSLKQGILSGDVSYVSGVKGVGKKTAERIILELAGKLNIEEIISENIIDGKDDAVDALMSLGYSEKDAKEMLKNVDKELKLEERVKLALKRR